MGKIFIGECDKGKIISDYIKENSIDRVYTLGEDSGFGEHTKFSDVIEYEPYYRLLQEINKDSLVILNECLRKKHRGDLHYNCIRHYIQQTNHVLIFQYYPIIDKEEDFAILMDFIALNPFAKQPYRYMTDFSGVVVGKVKMDINMREIEIDESYLPLYEQEKEKIISQVKRDPDIIPRRLLKFSEKINKKYVPNFDSLKERKQEMNVVVNQLKVDKYYYQKLLEWKGEVENVLHRIQESQSTGGGAKED